AALQHVLDTEDNRHRIANRLGHQVECTRAGGFGRKRDAAVTCNDHDFYIWLSLLDGTQHLEAARAWPIEVEQGDIDTLALAETFGLERIMERDHLVVIAQGNTPRFEYQRL